MHTARSRSGKYHPPAVLQCHTVLQEMVEDINLCRQGVKSTRIGDWWGRIWLSRWGGDNLASWNVKLSVCQLSLNKFLMALNSYVPLIFPRLTSTQTSITVKCCLDGPRKRLTCKLCVPGKVLIFAEAKSTKSSHVEINKVLVVDHLGRNLPVPMLFCTTWKVGIFSSLSGSGHTSILHSRILTTLLRDTAAI